MRRPAPGGRAEENIVPSFAYKARDGRGQLISGELNAGSSGEAARLLRTEGRFVIDIEQNSANEHLPIPTSRPVRRDDVIHFTQQMAMMLQTGVPVSEALQVCADQATNETFRQLIREVIEGVEAGQSLSAALTHHARVLPRVLISLVEASEAAGNMGAMFDRIAQYLSKEQRIVKRVRGAITYPAFMFLMTIVVVGFLLFFVLPKFVEIFENRGAALPMPTQILITISEGGLRYWYVWLSLVLAALAGFTILRMTPSGRRGIDYALLKAPIIGPLFRKLYIARAMHTMGTLLNAGVPMLDMIGVVRNLTGNVHFQELWDSVNDSICQGAQLSEPMSTSWLLPRSIPKMIYAGERSGHLTRVVQQIADFSETEFDDSVQRATQFIEPLMVTVIGVIIGGVAIALLLPIFTVGRVMAG